MDPTKILAAMAALWLAHPPDGRVTLKNGWIVPVSDCRVHGAALRWRDPWSRELLLPIRAVDLAKTYRPRREPPKAEPPPARRDRVPWRHPHYRHKTRTSRPIVISNERLRDFAASRPREGVTRPEQAPVAGAPPDAKKGPETRR